MRSLWSPNRFLRSVSPQFKGNPQPTRTYNNRTIARLFKLYPAKRKIRTHKIFIPKSSSYWRHP